MPDFYFTFPRFLDFNIFPFQDLLKSWSWSSPSESWKMSFKVYKLKQTPGRRFDKISKQVFRNCGMNHCSRLYSLFISLIICFFAVFSPKMLWLEYYYHHQSSVTVLHIEDNSWRTPCVVLYNIQLLQQLQVHSSLVSFTKIILVHSDRCVHELHQFEKKAGWERDKRVASLQSAQPLVQRKPQLHFIALVLQ